jgi:hypothetical protein
MSPTETRLGLLVKVRKPTHNGAPESIDLTYSAKVVELSTEPDASSISGSRLELRNVGESRYSDAKTREYAHLELSGYRGKLFSDSDRGDWGSGLGYSEPFGVGLQRAERMFRTLSALERRLAVLSGKLGAADTFAETAVRLGLALKVPFVVETYSAGALGRGLYSDNRYRETDASGLREFLRQSVSSLETDGSTLGELAASRERATA